MSQFSPDQSSQHLLNALRIKGSLTDIQGIVDLEEGENCTVSRKQEELPVRGGREQRIDLSQGFSKIDRKVHIHWKGTVGPISGDLIFYSEIRNV